MRFASPVPTARDQRGAALVTTILLLVLISVLVVSFLTVITGERSMSSNVQVARGAVYAADAGIRVAQQNLANLARTRLDSLIAIYSGSGPLIKHPSKVFPSGVIASTSTNPKFTANLSVVFTDSAMSVQTQIYNYRYSVSSTGSQGALGARMVQSQGLLRLSTGRGSFADYLLFTDKHTMPDGGDIWFTSSGYFQGRMHTNTQYRFHGTPTFEDLVTSVNKKAWYYNNGKNTELDADHNKTIDVPKFYSGFKRNQANVAMPTNSYGQQNAALGRDPNDTAAPSNATIRTALGLASSTSAPPNGIYFPNLLNVLTGGIYVQGTLSSCLASVDGSGRQVYTLKQGSTTRTVTIDRTLNTTTVNNGSTNTLYVGVPRGILYVVGSLSDLGGPNRSGSTIPPALADETQLLVCATGDIILQNDITYNDYNDGNSVLGLFTTGGKVRIGTGAPNDMELHAYVLVGGTNGCMEVDDHDEGATRGTFHLNGGIVATYYGAFGTFSGSNGNMTHGYARDFRYDTRGIIPPYFPTSSQLVANVPKARTLVWKEE